MVSIIEQLLTIITTPPGNLAYHMVLAFSISGALVSSINHYHNSDDALGRRTILGLSLILVARLGLFLVAGLAWQAFGIPVALLHTLDRAVNALCLVLIVWLWAFPEPVRAADAATVLLGLIVFVLFAFTSLWWANQAEGAHFNRSLADIIWQSFSLLITIAGIALLIYRRPRSWELGLGMLILFFLGHLAELLFPLGNSDYPGFIRLAQMAAYPMLLLLPQRTRSDTPSPVPVSQPTTQERRRYSIDPVIMDSFLALATETDPSNTCKGISRAVSQSMLADLCLLITPPDDKGRMSILCGYDLIRELPIEGVAIESKDTPRLAAAIRGRKPLRLLVSTTSTDLEGLRRALRLPSNGSLLAAPITIPGQESALGTVLLSIYSKREWTDDDQSYLLEINNFIYQVLQRAGQISHLEAQLAESREEAENVQQMVTQSRNQIEDLKARQDAMQTKSSQDHSQAESMAALVAAHEDAQETIGRLEAEIDTLRISTQSASADGKVTPQEINVIEGELRLTLEEVAHLRTTLAEADQNIQSLEKTLAVTDSPNDQQELAASIAQKLRQPLSSALGYTELLLSESVGILGALQRKFLDRIKASTERMGVLVEDLASLDTVDESAFEVASKSVDLRPLIIEAISYTDNPMKEKNITLNLDVSAQLPKLYVDQDALEQVMIHLLQNATAASPEDSEISLRAQVEKVDDELDYVLLQVSDMGEGIPADDLPRVFSSLYRADSAKIQGIGNTGVEMSIVKTLVEAHNGRIWVDTEQGKGSVFSILLPVSPAAASTPIRKQGKQST